MKKTTLHIFTLISFLFFITETFAQQKLSLIEQKWIDLDSTLDNKTVDEVKTAFNEFAAIGIQKNKDSILLVGIQKTGKYYKNHDEFAERIKWYQYAIDSLCNPGSLVCVSIKTDFASIYSSIGKYEEANQLLLSNHDYLDKQENFETQSINYSSIAHNYYMYSDFENAEKYNIKALRASLKVDKVFFQIHAYNNLGVFYKNINKIEKSNEIFRKAIDILENEDTFTENNKIQLALLKGNLGANLILDKNKEKQAIEYLNYDIKYNLENGEPLLAINAAIFLAEHHYKNKEFKEAEKVLTNCYENLKDDVKYGGPSPNMIQLYFWFFKVNMEQGQNEIALQYYEKYDSLKLSRNSVIDKNRLNIRKSLLENIFNAQLHNKEQEIKLQEKENEVRIQKNKYFFFRIIIGLIAVVLIAILIILYSRKRVSLMKVKNDLAENKFEVERLEKQKAKLELNYKNKDLTDFAIDISRKQEILTEVKSKLNEIISGISGDEKTKKSVRSLIQYTNNNLLVDDQLKAFQENVEEVNHKFIDRLQKKHPELSELDKNICGLIRLGLSNKEIAAMRNVSYSAIKMSRYRLRKKLGLDEDVNIVEFLKSIG